MKIAIRIILIVLIVLFLAVSLLMKAVNDGKSVKEEAYDSAKEIASESAGMVTYNDFYMYRGNEAWDVIIGEDNQGNEIGVWIPVESTTDEETAEEEVTEETTTEEKQPAEEETTIVEEQPVEETVEADTNEEQPAEEASKQGYILPMDEYLTEEEAVEAAIAGKDVTEVVSVNLGMENEVVLWEVTCINSEGNYSYFYVNASTGEIIKSYENI